MTEAEKQALAIYQMLRASSEDRPISGSSIEELTHRTNDWRSHSEALRTLQFSEPAVQSAFLGQSFQWLQTECRVQGNFRICQALSDAILVVLQHTLEPLSAPLVERLLAEIRQDFSMPRIYFPLDQFLSVLSREQLTEKMRAELRKLHLQLAPSPTGKIDERSQTTRNLIAALIHVDGEKQLDPGRGPWSQIVFDEIAAKDPITRSGWMGLLEHCHSLEQTVPGAKWSRRARELMAALGDNDALATMVRWLALGPTPGQPREARSPIEDSAYQKGVVLCVGLSKEPQAASAIADFAITCLRKIPNIGAVSQKVGFACIQALGVMECNEAVCQLTRLRGKVKYSVARRLIEKSLHLSAERTGLTVDELEDISIPQYPLDAQGSAEVPVADSHAIIRLCDDGRIVVAWRNASGKGAKFASPAIKKSFPKEVRSLLALSKQVEQAYLAQRMRLESSFLTMRCIPLLHWRHYYIDHPLLGFLGRKLIWVFSNDQGWERSGLWSNGEMRDSADKIVDLARAEQVRLWHPLSYQAAEVQRWRSRIFTAGIRQPFRQAFREFYTVTDDERQTRLYSNRFAGILMRQHQFASLCRARGWTYQLMGAGFDSVNVPSKNLDHWKMHAEFYVDLPPDRDTPARNSGLTEQSTAGINVFIGSDQVRFYRDLHEVPVDEVPAIVYSEIMRDVDLFTTVSAVGDDETWSDQGERGTGIFSDRFDIQDFSAITALRAEMLARVLPKTSIASRCKVAKAWLEIQGQLATYRIQLGWGGAMVATDSMTRWLKIPQKTLDAVPLDLSALPIDLDPRTEMILRKAYILADDWKIDSPDLVRQLMPD
jgi:Domain of unknown function (DUF4132)